MSPQRLRLTWLILAVLAIIGCSRCGGGPPPGEGAPHTDKRPDAHAEDPCASVDAHLVSITAIPPKIGEPQVDSHARAILSLGKLAAPCLVEKIPDATPTLWVYNFRYTVGDMALVLLGEIYRPASWPFPDGPSIDVINDYGSYPAFIGSPGMRARLRERWSIYVAAHRGSTQ